MTTEITPGRYRGLKTTSLAEKDVFGIVAFDQRGSYRRMMPDDTPYDKLVEVKVQIIGAMSKHASAILTDPVYGLTPAMEMSGKSGLLLALEKSGYSGNSTYRKPEFLDTWTPEKIRKVGASAVKLLVYYNPQNTDLADELDPQIADVIAECHEWDLPVFLEPMSYSTDENVSKDSEEYAAQRADIVVETARRLSKTGADVLKMEFPLDQKYNKDEGEWVTQCQRLSEAATVPWVLLSAGVDFDEFEPQVITACENGASGFLAGRAIWKEGAAMSPNDRAEFLATTATQRLKKLLEIAEYNARPWTEFYSVRGSSENWFDEYMEA